MFILFWLISAAYVVQQFIMDFHPDRHIEDPKERKTAERIFAEVNSANDFLKTY